MTIERIREANHLYEIEVRRASKKAVEDGGGVWVGIQEGMPGDWYALFNAPSGSTLAIKTSEITAQAVRDTIAQHEKLFRKAAADRCRADAKSGRTA